MCTRPERVPVRRQPQTGLTLVELVVSLALAGVVLTGIWGAWSLLGKASVDPLVARQQVAIAQSLLREIELQPLPAASAAAAATPGRTGYASILSYNGLTMTGITDAEGAAVSGLENYGATVSVTAANLGTPVSSGWWVVVAVSGPDGRTLQLSQWRGQR